MSAISPEHQQSARLNGPADRREGQQWTPPQTLKNWALRQLVRSLFWVADRLPERALLRACAGLGTLAWALLGHERRVASANLRRAGVALSARRVFRGAGRNLGLCLLLRRPNFDPQAWVSWSSTSRETLERALEEGRGAIFVSAHIGPFELVPAFVVSEGFPSAIVVRESYDPELDPLVDAHRTARGIEVIHRGHERAPLRMLRALRRGLPLGFLPDVGGRVPGTPVSFLGGILNLPTGPIRLARRLNCPLVVGTLEPSGDRFQLEVIRQQPPAKESTGSDPDRPLQTAAEQLALSLDLAIRKAPEGWLWMARDLDPDPVGERPSLILSTG